MSIDTRNVFCSCQPCKRFPEGDLTVTDVDGGETSWPVCARHHEFIMNEVKNKGIDPVTLLEREVVFVDDIAKPHRFIIDGLTHPYKIIEGN